MADWIQCQAYTEDRAKFWVNLDHVVTVVPHENGSVLRFAVPDGDGQLELVVWDRAEDLLPAKRGR